MNLKNASTEMIVKVLVGCERKADAATTAKQPVDPRLTATMRDCKRELDQREGQITR